MKALSLWQPWASAIALGAKRIETRGWPTGYRGPLLIHAARTKVGGDAIRQNRIMWAAVLGAPNYHAAEAAFHDLPFGALVARCELFDCVAADDTDAIRLAARRTGETYSPHERGLGDYSPGRYAWLLRDIRPLPKPIPMRAFQRLFDVDDGLLAAVAAEPKGAP